MPIYHFNLANHECHPDVEGTELADADQARIQAVIFAGAYLKDNPGLIWDGRRFRVEVTDDADKKIFTVAVETIDET